MALPLTIAQILRGAHGVEQKRTRSSLSLPDFDGLSLSATQVGVSFNSEFVLHREPMQFGFSESPNSRDEVLPR